MNVCMISYSKYYDSRPFRYALSLIEKGCNVDMICLGDKGHPNHEVMDGICVYAIRTREKDEQSPFSYLKNYTFFFFLSAFLCTKLYLKKKYDVIHFHNIPDFGVFCTLIPKLAGAKVILDIHDVVPEFYMRKFGVPENHILIKFLKWIEKLSCRYADHVITVTDIWEQRLVERSIEPSKCTVILNAPDDRLFKKNGHVSKKKKDAFLLSYHGNLKEPTGVDIAIRAMAIAKKRIPSLRLQIIGGNEGPVFDCLKTLTLRLKIEDSVLFKRSVPVDKIPQLIGQADIGIDPKRNGVYAGETLSVKAMEYLAMGIPLIVSRTRGAQDYFNDSMVMFFEPENENDLARCIVELYRSPQKRSMLSQNAQRFNSEYSWERYKKTYHTLLHDLCTGSKDGAWTTQTEHGDIS